MEKDTDIVRTSLRIPRNLYEKLEKASKTKGVTMHAEILTRIEETFGDPPMPLEFWEKVLNLAHKQEDIDARIAALEADKALDTSKK